MKNLRTFLKMSIGIPTPNVLIKIASKTFLDTDPELAIYGRYVRSSKLKKEKFKFEFEFETIENAFRDIYNKTS